MSPLKLPTAEKGAHPHDLVQLGPTCEKAVYHQDGSLAGELHREPGPRHRAALGFHDRLHVS